MFINHNIYLEVIAVDIVFSHIYAPDGNTHYTTSDSEWSQNETAFVRLPL